MAVAMKVERTNGALVVTPELKRLDARVASEFREELSKALKDDRVVVVSLEKVSFIDSTGLSALIAILKRLPAGASLRLAQANSAIQSLLRVTKLDKVLPVFDSVGSAQFA